MFFLFLVPDSQFLVYGFWFLVPGFWFVCRGSVAVNDHCAGVLELAVQFEGVVKNRDGKRLFAAF
jgi:hypothetical protein